MFGGYREWVKVAWGTAYLTSLLIGGAVEIVREKVEGRSR
jgi:hypothetical protein